MNIHIYWIGTGRRTSFLKAVKPGVFDPYCVKAPNQDTHSKPLLYGAYCSTDISIEQDGFLNLYEEEITLLCTPVEIGICTLLCLSVSLYCLFLSLVLWPQTSCSRWKAAGSYLISAWGNSLRFTKSHNNVVPKRNKTSSSLSPPPSHQAPHSREANTSRIAPKKTTPLRWQHFQFAIWFFFSLICALCAFSFVKRAQAFHFAFYLSCCRYSENVLAFQLVITHHHIPNL